MNASRGRGGGGGGGVWENFQSFLGSQEWRAAAPETERPAPRALSQWLRDAPSSGGSRGTRRVAAVEDAILQRFHTNATAT